MNVANKKLKHYQNSLNNKTNKFNLYNCVGAKIHSIDQTNTCANSLPCLIIEKIKNNEQVKLKLACQYGKLDNAYSLEHLIDLRMACLDELKRIVVDDLHLLKHESFTCVHRQPVKLAIVKSSALQSNVGLKKIGVFCSTKCHSRRGACKDMGE